MIARTIRLYQNSFSGLSRDVWILTLIFFINRSGTMVLPFLTIVMTSSKGFSLQEAGFMMSAFGMGSIVGANLGGRITDRTSPYPVMFWALFLSGLVFFMLLFVDSLLGYCGVLFLLSSIADTYRPANNAALAFYSKPENYTRSFGLIRLAANLGFAAGPGLGGIIIAHFSYDALFIVDGLTCILASFAILIFLDRNKIKESKAQKHRDEQSLGIKIDRRPGRDKVFLVFVLLNFLTALGFLQLFSTIPVFFKNVITYSETQVGLVMGFNGLLIALIEMPMVYSIENKYEKMKLVGIGAIIFGLAYLPFQMGGLLWMAPWMFVFLLTIGEILNMPFANAWVSERASAKTQGRYMGIFSMGWASAFIIGPTLSMYIAEHYDFPTLWILTSVICIGAGLGFLALRKKIALSE
ncbi:MAG: MFS transporter [Saprospiraceae bacterium]|nr:MFS transporter [Saprospiraceae bacterium]MCB9325804.1 MFS transporter [Lewinellaceae bacterium]